MERLGLLQGLSKHSPHIRPGLPPALRPRYLPAISRLCGVFDGRHPQHILRGIVGIDQRGRGHSIFFYLRRPDSSIHIFPGASGGPELPLAVDPGV